MKIIGGLLLVLISYQSHSAVTLKEAFEAAKNNMESIKRAKSLQEASGELPTQARAALLPTISGVANETRIDEPTAPAGVNRAFILTRQYSYALRMQQPILRGGVVSGYQLAKDQELLTQFQKDATVINLYQLVINSYFQYYQAQNDVKNLNELLRLSSERVREIRARTSVGRSRRGELVQAEAQLLTAQSQIDQGNINFNRAKENLEFFTGIDNIELAPLTIIPRELPGMTTYLDRVKTRPDLLASSQQVKIAERQIDVAKGGHYPQLDFVGNYYFDRTGALATSEWDAALVLSVPLFQGGAVQSRVRASAEQKNAAMMDYKQSLRTAETDVTVLYQNYVQMHSQLDALKKAVDKAEEAYRLNRRDYEYGQVTNLDVLQSLNIFIETKRTFDTLLAQAHMTYKNIEATTGVLP